MKNKLLLLFLAISFAVSAPVMAQPGSGAEAIARYYSIPFWLDGQTVPHVMLVLERDWKMFYPAYNSLADLDGDGALDIGFNPNATYVGYFDSDSCYSYNESGIAKFVRHSDASPQSQSDANSLAPSAIKSSSLSYPASKHGVCDASLSNAGGRGLWHGNWLNFAMTSRMDAIRKVLYGGRRVVDDLDSTLLEMIYIPGNSQVWGGELYADNIWESYAPSSPWYHIPSFTGYTKPIDGTMHFWARASKHWTNPLSTSTAIPSNVDHYTAIESKYPLFRFVANLPSANLHPSLKTPIRIWDWVGDHSSYGSLPHDGNLAKSKNTAGANNNSFMVTGPSGTRVVGRNFNARVEVCQKGNIGPNEGCRAYGSNFKPIGLLQEYGENGRMFFGLLTGSLQYERVDDYRAGAGKGHKEGGTRFRGGVVRHHIQPFNNYIDTTTGQIKLDSQGARSGIIATIDGLSITGLGKRYSSDPYEIYINGSQAGNPLGEMVWEATRYLVGGGKNPTAAGGDYTTAGGLQPVSQYLPVNSNQSNAKVEESVKDHNGSLYKLPYLQSWDGRPNLGGGASDCVKPVVLVISEVYPDHDDDSYANQADFNSVPIAKSFSGGSTKVPLLFSINEYLDVITDNEKISGSKTLDPSKEYFYPDKARGLCTSRPLTGGLKEVYGHCPSEPSLEGSYTVAAVSYYAHTHDFSALAGGDKAERNVDLYAVGIAGNFPDINIEVDSSRSLKLMPLTLTSLLGLNNYPERNADTEFKTLLNFFIEYWQTDDGHTYTEGGKTKIRKVPYKVKFSTNFEFTTYPCFHDGGNSNNWERDLFNTITISLMTPGSTPAKYREATPLFINSGPFKTDLELYKEDRSKNSYVSQTYYYAFKRSKGESLDISSLNVVGVAVHTDTFGSGYGSSGLSGYTISGVTFPGAYVDTGLYRADYPLFYTNKDSYTPGSIDVDEPVPLDPAGSGIPGARWSWKTGTMHGGYHYTHNGSDCYYYHPPTLQDPLLTPAECPYAGYTDNSAWTDPDLVKAYNVNGLRPKADLVCGIKAAGNPYPAGNSNEIDAFKTSLMRYVQVRSFKFEANAGEKVAQLPNPLWVAAKYGGFRDSNGNGLPDLDSEWIRGGDGIGSQDPYNYFGVANMSELPDQLGNAFEAIANSVGTGTANAASVNMVLGGGISLQTQYRTEYFAEEEPDNKISWAGTSYAFFVDKWGNLREDSNKNSLLDLKTMPNESHWEDAFEDIPKPNPYNEDGDFIIHIVATEDGTGLPSVYRCRDVYGDNNGNWPLPTDSTAVVNGPKYPPFADCQPADGSLKLDEVKSFWNAAENISNMNVDDRKLYTYYGANTANGSTAWPLSGVNLKTASPFLKANALSLQPLMGQTDLNETGDLIEYVRGTDFTKYRNRTVRLPWDPKGSAKKVWRMGDVINSRPMIVAEPNSYFDINYKDASYATYRTEQARRRQVAYFGSNDGILHAVNVGFFGSLANGQAGYSETPLDGSSATHHKLGDEIWGFIPPSLLPHLQLMADKDHYTHSYYVDLKPYIVEVKDGAKWRTILIGGLRLGGAPMELPDGSLTSSEFFAFDVTVPDADPTLLWRFSVPSLGQSTAAPVVVRSAYDDKWYVLLPSGPAQISSSGVPIMNETQQVYAGQSNQKARVIVLDVLTGKYVRSRDTSPGTSTPDPLMVAEENSFFNDAFLPRAKNAKTTVGVTTWGHHVAYLGLTAKGAFESGAVYRVQMVDSNGFPLSVNDWKLTRLYKTDKPVTGAVNSIYDAAGNLWVLFGTGRMWGKEDMTPCGVVEATFPANCAENHDQYLFGIKEPLSSSGKMTFAEVGKDDKIVDVSGVTVYENGDLYLGGAPVSTTHPIGGAKYDPFYYSMLEQDGTGKPIKNGYKLKLESWRRYKGASIKPKPTIFELVNTQIKVDTEVSGVVNAIVSTYVPSTDLCSPLGESYIMMYDAFTGLSAPRMINYGQAVDGGYITTAGGDDKQAVTSLIKMGAGMSSEVMVRKTDGGTFYEAVGFVGQRKGFNLTEEAALSTGVVAWREVLDLLFNNEANSDILYKDLVK